MIEWEKPSGSTITTNDLKATIEAAESLGWKRKDGKKRGRPPKAEKLDG